MLSNKICHKKIYVVNCSFSFQLSVGDQLDFVKGTKMEGSQEFNEIVRLEIRQLSGLEDDSDKFYVIVRKYHRLLLPVD